MRTTIEWSRTIFSLAATLVAATITVAAPPMPSAAEADYEASGFVTPAGMRPIGAPGVMPAMYAGVPGMPPGGVMHAGGMAMPSPPPGAIPMRGMPMGGNIMPAGFLGGQQGCDCGGFGCNRCTGGHVGSGPIMQHFQGGGCDGGCDGCGACAGGGGGGCGFGGCGSCLGDCGIGSCLFGPGSCLAGLGLSEMSFYECLSRLMPYGEAGQCAQRWYDVSFETVFLGRNGSGGGTGTVSTLGIGGPTALTVDQAGLGDLEAGIRLSGAIILGVGGNVEVTYMGMNKWEGNGSVTARDATGALIPNLYSFVSNFGQGPPLGGFDDSDASVRHAVSGEANFHSGEVNYRRRTVGPYCTYQGSWLLGLRYIRLDDQLTFSADGLVNNGGVISTPRFLDLTTQTSNDLFGVQVGGDFWWNVRPGINLGCELKLGLLENDINRTVFATGNSLGPGATPGNRGSVFGTSETTGMIEFNTTMIYRLTHSFAFRTSYHLLAVDEIAGGFDQSASNTLLTGTGGNNAINFSSMVLTGFSFGTEYTW